VTQLRPFTLPGNRIRKTPSLVGSWCLSPLLLSYLMIKMFVDNKEPTRLVSQGTGFWVLYYTSHVGLIILCYFKRTQILSGIQFTRHSIQFIVVETKQFVCSNVNVILMRPALEHGFSKTRALGSYFYERICYMFSVSKCRGD